MKKWVLVFTICIFAMFSCEDFDGVTIGLDDLGVKKIDLMEQFIEDQNLVITKFLVAGEDIASDFSDYGFVFSQNGNVSAINNVDTTVGTWALALVDSVPKIEIDFGSVSEPLDELNEDWFLVEQEDDLLELKDISGNDGNIDYLTFMKI